MNYINDIFEERIGGERFKTRQEFVEKINVIAEDICEDIWKWVRASEYSEKNIDETIEDICCECDEKDEDEDENLSLKGKIAKSSKYNFYD